MGCVTFNYRGSEITYTTVRAADGNEWLQQNLGASRIAESSADTLSYGDLFQWGRWDDGHQERWPGNLVDAVASPNNPTAFISNPNGPNPMYVNATTHWWDAGALTNTWNGASIGEVSSTNGMDPCKQLLGNGWRLPTGGPGSDWATLASAESISNLATAYSSRLKLPAAGYRGGATGAFLNVGTQGLYQSNTPHPSTIAFARFFNLTSTTASQTINSSRGTPKSVRCMR